MSKHILILEDEMIVSLDMQTTIEMHGYTVVGAVSSAEEALTIAQNFRVDLMIVDLSLRGPLTGEEAVSAIRTHFHLTIPVIFVTGTGDRDIMNRLGLEPCSLLRKPITSEKLIECIRFFLEPAA